MDSLRPPEFEQHPTLPLRLLRGTQHECAYLPERDACEQYTFPELSCIDSALYEDMMNAGFRRAGRVFYRPDCPTCTACVPIRVPVARFRPSRSQRRAIARNRDVQVKVGAPLLEAFPNAVLNIHPALLPSFPGLHAQRQAIAYGVKVSGVTVHLVTAELDNGPIIVQRPVPVFEDDTADTLAARILVEEHHAYPEAVQIMLDRRWRLDGRRFVRL